MTRIERRSLAAIPVIVLVAAAIGLAGGQGGTAIRGVPVFVAAGFFAFAINWLAFIPAYLGQTERYFDLMGSVTYVSLVGLVVLLQDAPDPRSLLLGGLIVLWALRLGRFLFARIRRDGSDGRFDAIKPSLPRFFLTWTLQGLWVFLTASVALAAMTSATPVPLGAFAGVGFLVWLAGFGIEVAADQQKRSFRADPRNRERFIDSGVWAWSRHPNYFGEITLWLGIAIIAFPALTGWQTATLISPVFVYLLLTRISGVPLLEARARKRWGEDPAYRAYTQRTPVLFPRPPRIG